MPITSTTSARVAPRLRGRRAGRDLPKARARAARSRSSSASLAARAAERAVSGRRAPGIARRTGDRSSSQASAVSAGLAPCAAATSTNPSLRPRPAGSARAAERRVRDHRDPQLRAPFDDPAAQGAVVERAHGDLDGRDGSVLEAPRRAGAGSRSPARPLSRGPRRRAGRAPAPTCATASSGRERGSGRGRSAGRRARPGSPRSRPGSTSPCRRGSSPPRPGSCPPS